MMNMKGNKLHRGIALGAGAALLAAALTGCGAAGVNSGVGGEDKTSTGGQEPAGQGSSDAYVTLKWADHNSDGCPTALAMDEMANRIMEATEGRVNIEVYHGGTLGSYADGLTMLETGVCDILWTSTALFAGQFPYTEVLSIPALGISTAQEATDIYWDLKEEFPEEFDPEFEDYYLWMAHSMPAVTLGTASKEVKGLGDLKGLNLRAAAGPAATTATLWGASPVSMSPADMYLSLEKGVIDGYIFDGAGIHTWGLAELTDHVYDMGLGYTIAMILMSPSAYNSLTEEDQAIFDELGGRVGSQVGAEFVQNEADELFAGMDNYNILEAGDSLYEELKAPLTTMAEDWAASTENGQAVIDYIGERVAYYGAQ